VGNGPPVLGRPSRAAEAAAVLRAEGRASDAAVRADGGDGEWCSLRAAAVTGVRHRLAGEAGQDSFAWAGAEDRIAVAVADGLGGVPDSAGAATRAVEASVVAAAASAAAGGSPTAQIAAAFDGGNAAAAGGGATTLVVAVLDPGGDLVVARIGDSTAFVVDEDGQSWRELFEAPTEVDSVTTTTAALPAEGAVPELAHATLRDGQTLVLATDGVADPWRDGPETVAPFLASALAGRPGPVELAQLADFSRQGCHDDRTVLLLWLGEEQPGEGEII
jgi:serine/threonine protein phosphatase PrpC